MDGFKLFGKLIQTVHQEGLQPKAEPPAEASPEDEVEAAAAAAARGRALACPRCKSKETKFCYFNNYNVNQPRHFCKACHRYWTAGGTLRNVPVGAGRRKSRPPGPSPRAGSGGGVEDVHRWLLQPAVAERPQQGGMIR